MGSIAMNTEFNENFADPMRDKTRVISKTFKNTSVLTTTNNDEGNANDLMVFESEEEVQIDPEEKEISEESEKSFL